MKFSKYFILSALIINCAVLNLPIMGMDTLPQDMLLEIVTKLGINKDAPTEKEIFQGLDTLRLVNKDLNTSVQNYIKTLKYKNYDEFKAGIMQSILAERAKKISPLPGKSTTKEDLRKFKIELLEQAIKSESYTWANYRRKQEKDFQKNLDHLIYKIVMIEEKKPSLLKKAEVALKFGANPNQDGRAMPNLNIILMKINEYKDNARFDTTKNKFDSVDSEKLNVLIDLLKLLLKYKADPEYQNQEFKSDVPIEVAKGYLSSINKYFANKPGPGKKISEVFESIIKLFKNSIEEKKKRAEKEIRAKTISELD